MTSLRVPLCWTSTCLGIALCAGVQVGAQGAAVKHQLLIPDEQLKNFSLAMEARDEQDIVSFKRGEKKLGVRTLVATVLATSASILPAMNLGKWTKEDDFKNGQQVAVVVLNDGDIKDLHLEKGANFVFIYFKSGSWYALINNDVSKRLNITRYTYDGVADDSFPPTARWDWEGATPIKPLFGVLCARAWCLVGTAGASNGGADPSDPGKAAENRASRRVRGWFDRKYNTSDGSVAWVYPAPGTTKYKDKKEFKNVWGHLASIRLTGGTGDMNVEFIDKGTGPGDTGDQGDWYAHIGFGFPTPESKAIREDKGLEMPPAARWSTSYFDLKIPKPLSNSKIKRLTTAMDLGEVWVRCASGCCSADVIF